MTRFVPIAKTTPLFSLMRTRDGAGNLLYGGGRNLRRGTGTERVRIFRGVPTPGQTSSGVSRKPPPRSRLHRVVFLWIRSRRCPEPHCPESQRYGERWWFSSPGVYGSSPRSPPLVPPTSCTFPSGIRPPRLLQRNQVHRVGLRDS